METKFRMFNSSCVLPRGCDTHCVAIFGLVAADLFDIYLLPAAELVVRISTWV